MRTRLIRHPLHLVAIAAGLVGTAVAFWTAQSEGVVTVPLMIAFGTAISLARRLGLEPPNDPAAPHNRGKV